MNLICSQSTPWKKMCSFISDTPPQPTRCSLSQQNLHRQHHLVAIHSTVETISHSISDLSDRVYLFRMLFRLQQTSCSSGLILLYFGLMASSCSNNSQNMKSLTSISLKELSLDLLLCLSISQTIWKVVDKLSRNFQTLIVGNLRVIWMQEFCLQHHHASSTFTRWHHQSFTASQRYMLSLNAV